MHLISRRMQRSVLAHVCPCGRSAGRRLHVGTAQGNWTEYYIMTCIRYLDRTQQMLHICIMPRDANHVITIRCKGLREAAASALAQTANYNVPPLASYPPPASPRLRRRARCGRVVARSAVLTERTALCTRDSGLPQRAGLRSYDALGMHQFRPDRT
jgi:hypothetical protein